MDTVKMFKASLQVTVKENREKHQAEFEKAFNGYRAACIKALEQNLTAFKERTGSVIIITERKPEDHTKDYDRVLKMLEASVDETVILSAEDFERYVLDEWRWKQDWVVGNSKYLGG